MSGFSTNSIYVWTSDGRNFTLVEAFTYTRPSGEVINVPPGSQSDGASTPRALWTTFPPFGLYWKAAYLHDYMYRYTKRPKEECDQILKEAMESLGVDETEAQLIYEGVNLGGDAAFNQDRQKET